MNSFPTTTTNLLDLPKNQGRLEDRFVDLPARRATPDLHYVRQQDRSSIPTSYRSGLAFFVMVIVFSIFGMTALQAQTMADANQESLQDQMIASFLTMSSQLQAFAPKEPLDVLDSLSNPSPEVLHAFDEQARFVELGLKIQKGSEAFQDFLGQWKETEQPLLERLQWMERSAQDSLKRWDEALATLQTLPLHRLLSDERARLNASLGLLSKAQEFLSAFLAANEPVQIALGRDQPQRLLVFLQDSNEQRASGGALSAGVEILLDEGKVLSWKPFHVAEYDAQFQGTLPAPAELAGLSEQWNLATANSFLDGTRSAEQVAWFWQHEARSSADLLVFVNTTALERLFALLPPDVNQENLSLRWTALRLSDQRQALKDLASTVVASLGEILQQPQLVLEVWPELQNLREEKQFVVISPNDQLQSSLAALGLTPPLPSSDDHTDFLMVASINTEANGSDRWIAENIQMHTAISADGTLKNWLRLERSHRWENSFRSPLLEKISNPLTNGVIQAMSTVANRSMIRVLVPKGSQLKAVNGLALLDVATDHTDTHTVWSFRNEVRPGETSVVELSYELPWTFDTQTVDNYRLNLAQQTGSNPMGFEHVMKLPTGLTVFQDLPEAPITEMRQDMQIAIVAGKIRKGLEGRYGL